ncbi:ABC transporter permease [Nocardioides sp. GY 10127]|uniref:ABC transporter permease n=1 Tax=Nocardioides sp. GY 10127 TaxID=2569762 RepID=UPI0010A7964C|nr:ABC transporter permease [Nocardioides sp. GY 10127]TIC79284.1 ABC transporter permease [Nocardioides sp. GY 10127]
MSAAVRFELRKLAAQWRVRALLLAALLGPIPVALVMSAQANPPKDTLFGRFALDNGFALALMLLGFLGQWVLPLLTSVVAGDSFASEDQHGTWKTVLTRSTSRNRLFWAKVLVNLGLTTLVLVVLAASTIASALLVEGAPALTGLTGQLIAPGHALWLVAAAWLSVLPPLLGFTCLALLMSVWTRSSAAAIAVPVVLALAMQMLGSVGTLEPVRPFLLTTAFESWHGLLTDPRFTGPLLEGFVVSAAWAAVCLAGASFILHRRDITGG